MYRRRPKGWIKNVDVMLLSFLALHLALILSFFIHIEHTIVYTNSRYLNISVILSLGSFLSAIFFNIFKNYNQNKILANIVANIKQVIIVDTMAVFYFFGTQKGIDYSRIVFSIYFPLFYFVFSFLILAVYKILYRKLYADKEEHKSLLIFTTSNLLESLALECKNNSLGKYNVLGVMLIDSDGQTDSHPNNIDKFKESNFLSDVAFITNDSYKKFINQQWIDEVLVVTDTVSTDLSRILDEFTDYGITVHFAFSNSFYKGNSKQFTSKIGPYIAITSTLNYVSYEQAIYKRLLDICGALVGCFITLLLTIIVAPILFIMSPGPIFFKQKRVGIHGKVFNLYKFRTMYLDAEARKKELESQNIIKDGMMFKMEFDPRIVGNKILKDGTKKEGFGALLRKLSIDEFPQFFNVLKGDMSIVGTRPPTVDEWNKYELYHKSRLFIKPGITGLWQVSGRSKITSFDEVVKLDRAYIKEWSFINDIKIILKTIKTVIYHNDSY